MDVLWQEAYPAINELACLRGWVKDCVWLNPGSFSFRKCWLYEIDNHWHVLSLIVSLLMEWVGESTVPEQHVSYRLPSSCTFGGQQAREGWVTRSREEVWATHSYFAIWGRMDLGLTSDEVLGYALCWFLSLLPVFLVGVLISSGDSYI